MKKLKLSTLENKYYYGISRYFWHFIIALAIIGVIAGIATLTWSKIPVSKKKVVKPAKPVKPKYPQQKTVSYDALVNALPKDRPKRVSRPKNIEIEENLPPPDEKPVKIVDSAAIANFERELGYTKMLIPYSSNKSFWEGAGKYVFKNSRDEKMYRKTHNPKYKTWVPAKEKFKKRYIKYTKKENLEGYNQKTALLKGINAFLSKVAISNRKNLVNNKLLYTNVNNYGLENTVIMYSKIGDILSKLDTTTQFYYYYPLKRFVRSNPNDGIKILEYVNKLLDKTYKDQRPDFMDVILKEYKDNYNNNLSSLIEATNQFMPYLKNIAPEQQAEALKIFYKLYRQNNADRSNRIRQIESDYAQTIQNWEAEFQKQVAESEAAYFAKKRAKKELSEWSYKGIVSSFGVVLIISLFLLVLSMVRNVNKLSEAILENNKLFSENITENKKEQNHKINDSNDDLNT